MRHGTSSRPSSSSRTGWCRALGALVASLLLVTVAACGSGSSSGSADHAGHGGATADVAFAQQMIPHHRQAVEMAEMVDGRDVDPRLARLAAQIEAAQAPEIRTMSAWLKAWGRSVPTGSMHEGHAMSGGSGMPGMMSDADMSGLRAATGTAFEKRWLSLMVEHHRGALTMARTEREQGTYRPAVALAGRIIAGQSDEIRTMDRLLATL